MAWFEVNSCCCCISLRKGVITLAILRLIIGILATIFVIILRKRYSDIGETYTGNLLLEIAIPILAFMMALDIALLLGASLKKPFVILVYQVITGCLIITNWVLVIIMQIKMANPMISTEIIGCVLPVYFWLVIHSYYKKLRREEVVRTEPLLTNTQNVRVQKPLGERIV